MKKAILLMYGTYVAPTFHWVADTSRLMEVYQTLFAWATYTESDNAPVRKRSGHVRLAASLVRFVLQKCAQEGDLHCIMQRMSG